MNFNYDKTYSIKFNQVELDFFKSFISSSNLSKLYEDYEDYKKRIKNEDFDLDNKNKKLHFSDSLSRLIEEDKLTDELVKKQFARSLVLEKFLERKMVGSLELNSILTYELYIAVKEEIERNNITLSEDLSLHDETYDKKKAKQVKADNDNVILRSLSNKIIQAVSLKDIYTMKLDYDILSILEHKELCLK